MTAAPVTRVALTWSEKSPGAAGVTGPLLSSVEQSGTWQEYADFIVGPEFKSCLSRKKNPKTQDLLNTLQGLIPSPLFSVG